MSRSTQTAHPISVTDKKVGTAKEDLARSSLGGTIVSTHQCDIRRAKELKAGSGGK